MLLTMELKHRPDDDLVGGIPAVQQAGMRMRRLHLSLSS